MRMTMVMILMVTSALVVPAAGSAQAPTPAPPLTEQQSAALLPVIDDAQVLDATKPPPARLARYASACRRLPVTDRLVAAFRVTCRTEGDAFTAGLRLPTCRSTARCRIRLTRYAADLAAQAAAARRLNQVITTAVPDTDCRLALRTNQPVLRTVARLQSAARKLVAAIGSGTAKQVNAGVARFYSIDRSPLFDHRGRLDSFRAACL